jgi:hypothetical protein
MGKLKLKIAELEVASFEVRAESGARWTVRGHLNETASGPHITCDAAMETCAYTCAQTGCGQHTCIAFVCGGPLD